MVMLLQMSWGLIKLSDMLLCAPAQYPPLQDTDIDKPACGCVQAHQECALWSKARLVFSWLPSLELSPLFLSQCRHAYALCTCIDITTCLAVCCIEIAQQGEIDVFLQHYCILCSPHLYLSGRANSIAIFILYRFLQILNFLRYSTLFASQ